MPRTVTTDSRHENPWNDALVPGGGPISSSDADFSKPPEEMGVKESKLNEWGEHASKFLSDKRTSVESVIKKYPAATLIIGFGVGCLVGAQRIGKN